MSTEPEISNERKKELKQEAKEQLKQKEKQKSSEVLMRGEQDKTERVKTLFDKIEFLSLTNEEKQNISVEIKEHSKIDTLYIIEIISSVVIATLGLLQNSVAVVVGAMLIAPIMRPINGLSYSIARGGQDIFKKSFFMILVSFFLSILLAFVATKLIGFELETSEILARTNPNLIDFFIALFSGMIGVMSIKYTRLGSGLAGVAMAVALIPPLAVVGIELAFVNISAAFGAFLLFLTNILAIGLVSTIFFWLYGFTPHNKNLQSKVGRRLMIFLFSLILILIPLYISYNSLITTRQISFQIQKNIETFLELKTREFEVSKVNIISNTHTDVFLNITLKIKEGVDVESILESLKGSLKKKLKKNVNLEFEIIRTLKV